jgi:hypothetical protein
MQILEAQHPGLFRKVDEMLEAFATVRAVSAMIQAEYGERLSHTSIWTYKRESWRPRRDQIQARETIQAALQELASEERI